ncbi:toluene hydroxylase [Pseudonocardia endophytica]|uniref:propane 2-monooxygenase n=1 Tax=Pseudonocardia endophytica TaxID=401976 RepID=A0A4R1I0M4_PSEEN|nr:toluene hydroxylase [Pseudonocardia endophytica]TCK26760.1 toluene monooxygenase system protein E [Pseudonocardia endophytica]
MTETPSAPPAGKRLRTWSAFGDIRKRPSEYEIVTEGANWTLRSGRKAPLEGNPSSPGNLWLTTYRDKSPLQVEDWGGFRDPDAQTYRSYVALQDEQESQVNGLLEQYAEAGADATLGERWRHVLAHLLTPQRYPLHGLQKIEAYLGYVAPSPYITNAAALGTADLLRRVTRVAYRTRELQLAHPEGGFGTGEREVWERAQGWQPTREAVELALISYDWAEAFTAVNLVLLPTLDDVLLRQFGDVARENGDELTWLLNSYLSRDTERRARWSAALARYAVEHRPANADVLGKWIARWSPRADAAAESLGTLLETLPERGRAAGVVADQARDARTRFHAELGLVPATAG